MLKAIFFLSLVALATCLLGGFETVDVDDEGVVAAAGHAAEGVSKQFAGSYHHKLAKILKAERQVVAGVNYKIDIIVGKTNCKKGEVKFEEASECEFQDGISTYKKCTVMVNRDLKGNHKLLTTGCILASKKDL